VGLVVRQAEQTGDVGRLPVSWEPGPVEQRPDAGGGKGTLGLGLCWLRRGRWGGRTIHLYVIADDEHSLGVFELADNGPGRLFRLFAGELPSRPKDRKAEKPDLEAMAVLPAFDNYPFGALLAVGSGSEPNRQRAALLLLDGNAAIDGSARHVDLAPLRAAPQSVP